MAIHAYLRTSTDQQDLETQRLEIETYAKNKNLEIDDWIEVEISSRKKKALSWYRPSWRWRKTWDLKRSLKVLSLRNR